MLRNPRTLYMRAEVRSHQGKLTIITRKSADGSTWADALDLGEMMNSLALIKVLLL